MSSNSGRSSLMSKLFTALIVVDCEFDDNRKYSSYWRYDTDVNSSATVLDTNIVSEERKIYQECLRVLPR
jgi:hypothetical protein